MKRKGPQKHSTETIQKAIAKYEGGARLSVIARELGLRKSTVKYWLDNATKFLGEESGQNPVAMRIQNRLARESWDIIFAALKSLKGKLDQASVRDLVAVVSELFDRRAQIGALTDRQAAPERFLEKSEEVRITVQKFLQRKAGGPDPLPSDLGGAPVEPLQTETSSAQPEGGDAAQGEGNGAT
jgi:transposase-like protein